MNLNSNKDNLNFESLKKNSLSSIGDMSKYKHQVITGGLSSISTIGESNYKDQLSKYL